MPLEKIIWPAIHTVGGRLHIISIVAYFQKNELEALSISNEKTESRLTYKTLKLSYLL